MCGRTPCNLAQLDSMLAHSTSTVRRVPRRHLTSCAALCSISMRLALLSMRFRCQKVDTRKCSLPILTRHSSPQFARKATTVRQGRLSLYHVLPARSATMSMVTTLTAVANAGRDRIAQQKALTHLQNALRVISALKVQRHLSLVHEVPITT